MPSRTTVARELAGIFKAIAHPDRIRAIEELRWGGLDVNTLAERLGLGHARVSQHLGVLRLHRVVEDQRDGRRAVYSLVQPELASWILEALPFIEGRRGPETTEIETARRLWKDREEPADGPAGASA